MQELTIEQMEVLAGEGFWRGVLCGATAGALLWALTSPEPLSKMAVYSLAAGVAGCLA